MERKSILSPARYDVVQTLIEAGESGLAKDDLDRKSGHTEARKLLSALAKSDRDWKSVIRFPGKDGMGKHYESSDCPPFRPPSPPFRPCTRTTARCNMPSRVGWQCLPPVANRREGMNKLVDAAELAGGWA